MAFRVSSGDEDSIFRLAHLACSQKVSGCKGSGLRVTQDAKAGLEFKVQGLGG